MARMFPPEPRDDTESNAEREVFRRIRAQVPNDWIALHSLGLGHQRDKPWTEIDFVLIGPPGVVCLEVKGGRIRREEGRWQFIDKNGRVTVKGQGPFEQVGSASAALRAYLAKRLPRLSGTAVGYGVATPDIDFSVVGPDIVSEVVYDASDFAAPFSDYLKRIANYWCERLERQKGSPPRGLAEADREELLKELRGDFDLRPTIRSRIAHTNDELLRLTKQQYQALDTLRDSPRVLVRGGAGTGKTLLAVEEARRRAAEGARVFLCCFNKQLGAQLRAATRDMSGIHASHLHGFMASTVGEAGLHSRIAGIVGEELYQRAYPAETLEALDCLGRIGSYDMLIVDEAQDLLAHEFLDVFDFLIAGQMENGSWKLFYDPYQDIFRGTRPGALDKVLSYRPAQCRLSLNCRNTKAIALTTRILTRIACHETLEAEGPDVEWIWYRDSAHQRREVTKRVKQLLGEGIPADSIVVLSHHRRENGPFAGGESHGLRLRDVESSTLEPGSIGFATIQAFKGLEADVIVLTDTDNLGTREAEFGIYVGATRARALLILCMPEHLKAEYATRAEEFGRGLGNESITSNPGL